MGGIKLVITDNHQLFLDGLISILTSVKNISIIGTAANGLELIKLLDKGIKPDIILTEIRLPKLDGIAATKILKKKYPQIPILIVTMYHQKTYLIKAFSAGANGYVNKCFSKEELFTAIDALANGNYYLNKKIINNVSQYLDKIDDTCVLTHRENEILSLLARGKTSMQISEKLIISKFTVDTHRKNIHKKLGIKSNTGLVNYALKRKSTEI